MGFTHLGIAPVFAPLASGNLFLADDFERASPWLGAGDSADHAVGQIAAVVHEYDLQLIIDIVIDQVARDGAMARSAPGWFHHDAGTGTVLDPRHAQTPADAVPARFEDPTCVAQLREWWVDRLIRLARAGAAGFRLIGLESVPPDFLDLLLREVRLEEDCSFFGWTPGVSWPRYARLEKVKFDGVFASTAWWDGRASWFIEEHNALRRIAPVLSVVEAPFGERLASQTHNRDLPAAYQRALALALGTGHGLFVPMGFEHGARERMRGRLDGQSHPAADSVIDLTDDVRNVNAFARLLSAFGARGEMRRLTDAEDVVAAHLIADAADVRAAEQALVLVVNMDHHQTRPVTIPLDPPSAAAGAAFTSPQTIDGTDLNAPLESGETRLVAVTRTRPVRERTRRIERVPTDGARVAIERVTPSVDDGAFAVKRVVGSSLRVEADIFTDGHELLAAALLWKAVDDRDWNSVPLAPIGNDRWQGTFAPTRIGRHLYAVEAWRDDYASLCHDIAVKHAAGNDIALEIIEARQHLEALSGARDNDLLQSVIDVLRQGEPSASVAALDAPATRAAVAATETRAFVTRSDELVLEVERPQAEFASWYELFPRSQSGDPHRHGTFADVIRRLPDIHRMGFDVLYFTPIHPIGRTNRKGRNNSLTPAPDDLGSPYAIGSEEGGHDAIHPQLGTPEDFRKLVTAARRNGLEIALDFAIQCSPDHPWLKQHPDWFDWRPDGSIKYAENPPKKYQDIVNVDFYADGARPELWKALRDVVLHWVGEGVRIFRVDNPHTKPLPFWQWMIADVRSRHPDVIFLSEAFTRPKMMYRLAKVGFSQSYTYFTWRNSKQEFIDYLGELTTSNAREFFRPHFFVNTPDINPYFLQTSGRPGFLIRAALATTLSGLWGVYSGFELCEGAPLPGREEYLDSEKYEIRMRDQNAPGNIVAEITQLNRIRRANPALQTHLGVTFYNAFNDQILLYGKRAPSGGEMILVAVSFDPHNVQEATFELPLWEWKLPDHGSARIEDLMRGHSFVWTGKLQRVRLDPTDLPFAIWRVVPLGGTL
jgi:starch synthase (maltosyl-transferring)